MPDTKFSQFTDGGGIIRGDTVVGLRAGVNTKFFFDVIDSPTTINMYVSNQGNNATARPGSPVYPYKTAKAAFDVIIANGDFSAAKNYAVYLQGVITETAQVKVPPFCHLLGDGSLHNLGGFTLIHNAASWGAANQFFTFNNIDYTGQSVSFLLSALANNIRSIKFHNCIGGTFAFTSPSTLTFFIFQNNLTTNPYLGGNGTLTGNGGAYLFTGATNFDTVTLINALGQTNANFDANILPRVISCNSNGTGALTVYIFACDPQMNATGITMNASVDACTLITDTSVPNGSISLLNGATVSLSSQAQMLLPGFNPTNYTPSAATTGYPTSVKNHLQGINTSLHKITIDLHVSAQGDDTNGTGALTAPYLTAKKAFDVITAAADYSATKQYNVYLHGVITESSASQIQPYVNIIGDGSLWNMNGNTVSLGAGWGAANQIFNCFNVIVLNNEGFDFQCHTLANNYREFNWFDCIFALNESNSFGALTLTGVGVKTLATFIGCIGSTGTGGAILTSDGVYAKWIGGSCPWITATDIHGVGLIEMIGGLMPAIINITGTSIINTIRLGLNGCSPYGGGTNAIFDGPRVSVVTDDSSLVSATITINNSANVYFSSGAPFIYPDYTPANYTPAAPPTGFQSSVKDHLIGIDNALTSTLSAAASGGIYRVEQTWLTTSTLRMGDGYVDIYDISIPAWVTSHYAANIDLDITTTGANGLDTGTVAAGQWYYILAIGGSTPAWLLTLSPDTPVLPSGYTRFRTVGVTKTAIANTNLLQYNFMGIGNHREYQWTEIANFTDLVIINASSSVAQTNISCYTGQPVEAGGIQSRKVKLRIVFKSTGVGDFVIVKDNGDSSLNFYSAIAQITANDIDSYVEIFNPSGLLKYSISTLGTTSTSLFIRGFTISV